MDVTNEPTPDATSGKPSQPSDAPRAERNKTASRRWIEESVGEGDLVAQMIHFEGTHTGDFQGLPPTHRRVTFSGLELNRFVDGRVAEHWVQLDSLALLKQLGLVVVPGPRLLPRILAHQLTKLRKRR